jgi:hypothetical protein
MPIQSLHAVATRPALRPERVDVSAHRAPLRALILAGARGAVPAAVTAALMRYWQELRLASVTQRRSNGAEAAAVWCAFADCDDTPSGEFIAEWRACV